MEKLCAHCKQIKSTGDFRKNKSKKDGCQAYCIICDKKKQSEWYEKNKERCLIKTKEGNEVRRKINQKFIIEYLKEHPCEKCNESDIVVLQFDHLTDKKSGIAQLICSGNIQQIKTEILKCQVLCANCHTRKTAKDNNWYKLGWLSG